MPPSQETISNTLRSVLLAGGVVCGLVVVMLKSGVYFVFRLEDHRKMPGLDSRKLTYAQSWRVACAVCRDQARALSPLVSCVVYHMHFIHKLALHRRCQRCTAFFCCGESPGIEEPAKFRADIRKSFRKSFRVRSK